MQTRILTLLTRTPLHVGAGASVGAIDQPIQRERHTGFPIIPASSLKGTFADAWNDSLLDETKDEKKEDRPTKRARVTSKGQHSTAAWLFGSDSDQHPCAGSLLFCEARTLAFPIRSAKGSFAWITCPLMLQRAARDGAIPSSALGDINQIGDDAAMFIKGGKLDAKDGQIVLEEYCFKHQGNPPEGLAEALAGLSKDDLWKTISSNLVIISNGMMSHFSTTACEIAQHVRISDETGTAERGGLYNQENVPADTLFYALLHCLPGRSQDFKSKTAQDAATAFSERVIERQVFQFGGDASTGLGFCTVELKEPTSHQ